MLEQILSLPDEVIIMCVGLTKVKIVVLAFSLSLSSAVSARAGYGDYTGGGSNPSVSALRWGSLSLLASLIQSRLAGVLDSEPMADFWSDDDDDGDVEEEENYSEINSNANRNNDEQEFSVEETDNLFEALNVSEVQSNDAAIAPSGFDENEEKQEEEAEEDDLLDSSTVTFGGLTLHQREFHPRDAGNLYLTVNKSGHAVITFGPNGLFTSNQLRDDEELLRRLLAEERITVLLGDLRFPFWVQLDDVAVAQRALQHAQTGSHVIIVEVDTGVDSPKSVENHPMQFYLDTYSVLANLPYLQLGTLGRSSLARIGCLELITTAHVALDQSFEKLKSSLLRPTTIGKNTNKIQTDIKEKINLDKKYQQLLHLILEMLTRPDGMIKSIINPYGQRLEGVLIDIGNIKTMIDDVLSQAKRAGCSDYAADFNRIRELLDQVADEILLLKAGDCMVLDLDQDEDHDESKSNKGRSKKERWAAKHKARMAMVRYYMQCSEREEATKRSSSAISNEGNNEEDERNAYLESMNKNSGKKVKKKTKGKANKNKAKNKNQAKNTNNQQVKKDEDKNVRHTPQGSNVLLPEDAELFEQYLEANFNDSHRILAWILDGARTVDVPGISQETFGLFGETLLESLKHFLMEKCGWEEAAADKFYKDALKTFNGSFHNYHGEGNLPANFMQVRLVAFVHAGLFSESTLEKLGELKVVRKRMLGSYYTRLFQFKE